MSNILKPIHYPASFLTEKLQPKLKQEDRPKASQYCLAKYFPKSHQKLEMPSKPNWAILKKIKQVKTLHHLKIEYFPVIEKKFVPLLRRLLQNKRKNMKSIPHINDRQSLELGMFLPNIKMLNLSSKWKYGWLNRENQLDGPKSKIWRFYKRFWLACRRLESVMIFEYDHDLLFLIHELNKPNKVLPSLKNFALIFETSYDSNSLSEVKGKFEKLSPSLSSFMNLKEESFTSFAPLLISLLLSCSNLNVRIRANKDTREYVNIFQNEETLTFKVWNPEVLFNHQAFPNSLQKLSRAISHYGRVSKYHRPKELRALEFKFYDISDRNGPNEDFLSSLLKEALDIESLVLKFSFAPYRYSYLQLSPALDALSNFKSLKYLTILDESKNNPKRLSLNLNSAPEKILSLSQLTSLNIDCLVQEDSFSKGFLSGFLAEHMETKNISCSKVSFSSFQSLTEFFQTLNNYEALTEQNANFKVHLRVNHIEDVLRGFESCLSLRKKIPMELTIDSRAGSTVPACLSKEIMGLLEKRFPQFKITNNLPSDIFLLKI